MQESTLKGLMESSFIPLSCQQNEKIQDDNNQIRYRSIFGNPIRIFHDVSLRVLWPMATSYEHHLILISRSGSGKVFHFPVDADSEKLLDTWPQTENWSPIKDVVDFSCVVLHNKIYILGGYDAKNKTVLNGVHCFNPETGKWRDCPGMHSARTNFAATVYKDGIWVSGGVKSSGELINSCEFYTPHSSQSWKTTGHLLAGRAGHMMASVGDILYLAGGVRLSHCRELGSVLAGSEGVWQYRAKDHCWSEIDSEYPHALEKPTARHSMVALGKTLYFIGGLKTVIHEERHRQMTMPMAESFTPEYVFGASSGTSFSPMMDQREWFSPWDRSLPSSRHPRHDAAAVAMGSSIYLFGGSTTNEDANKGIKEVEVFDTISKTWTTLCKLRSEVDLSNVTGVLLKYPILSDKRKSKRQTASSDSAKHSSSASTENMNSDSAKSPTIYYKMNYIY